MKNAPVRSNPLQGGRGIERYRRQVRNWDIYLICSNVSCCGKGYGRSKDVRSQLTNPSGRLDHRD